MHIALITGCIAKVQLSDNWVAFGETLLQLVMLQSAECNQRLHLPVAIEKIIINPLEHQDKTQGLLIRYVCDLQTVKQKQWLCVVISFKFSPDFCCFTRVI
jgi:hypothetical protein